MSPPGMLRELSRGLFKAQGLNEGSWILGVWASVLPEQSNRERDTTASATLGCREKPDPKPLTLNP